MLDAIQCKFHFVLCLLLCDGWWHIRCCVRRVCECSGLLSYMPRRSYKSSHISSVHLEAVNFNFDVWTYHLHNFQRSTIYFIEELFIVCDWRHTVIANLFSPFILPVCFDFGVSWEAYEISNAISDSLGIKKRKKCRWPFLIPRESSQMGAIREWRAILFGQRQSEFERLAQLHYKLHWAISKICDYINCPGARDPVTNIFHFVWLESRVAALCGAVMHTVRSISSECNLMWIVISLA